MKVHSKLNDGIIYLLYESPGQEKSYPVGLDLVDTQEKLLAVIQHLTPKAWVTRSHIRDLIYHANEENDLKINFMA